MLPYIYTVAEQKNYFAFYSFFKNETFFRIIFCFLGGLDLKAQEAAIRLGLDIVIATPGRLIDLLHNCPTFSLADIEVGLHQ